MNKLWTFEEFESHDAMRAQSLREAPPWNEIVAETRHALNKALGNCNARFGMDESSRATRDLRGIVQFPLGRSLFDTFFNSHTGYRAQFRMGSANGLARNAELVRELRIELESHQPTTITIHMFTSDFEYKESRSGNIGEIASTLDEGLSKVWFCEKLIQTSGAIDSLFVSRTGPKLRFCSAEAWASLYPEDGDGWLDVKGAFIGSIGAYQFKSPSNRAADLEERGTA